jgi:hypothetical protein
MDISKLTIIVSLILALSIASERLVEIIKGSIPFLNKENSDANKEGWRRATLHVLAVVAGIITALLARSAIPENVYKPSSDLSIVSLGLLASGGSGLWNSILTYFLKIKDLKELDVKAKKQALGESTSGEQ